MTYKMFCQAKISTTFLTVYLVFNHVQDFFSYCHSSTPFNQKCSMWISAWENMHTRYSAAQYSCNFWASHWDLFEFLEIYLSANDIVDLAFKCPNNMWQKGLRNDATPDTIAKMSMNIIWSVGVSLWLHAVSVPVYTLRKKKKKTYKT